LSELIHKCCSIGGADWAMPVGWLFGVIVYYVAGYFWGWDCIMNQNLVYFASAVVGTLLSVAINQLPAVPDALKPWF
jgi:hypothetical protein